MNREQAIEIIERHIDNNIASGSLVEQALSMAIDALKAQLSQEDTTSDLISRRETIDRFNVIRPADPKKDEYTKGIDVGIAMCIVAVKDQPTIQPEPQWIPVSERMPRDGTWNIFTDGKNISVERYKADAIDHFFPNGRWFQLEDVIAWMPLPTPYTK